jgi:glycerol-3-phosphate dehydrogenase
VILEEMGLISVMGGKLTTYRLMAHQTLERACALLSDPPRLVPSRPLLDPTPEVDISDDLSPGTLDRLIGRYGSETERVLEGSACAEFQPIKGSLSSWAEIRWAARQEGVSHLDDLLLRRVRVGLVLPDGAASLLDQVQEIARTELGWADERWSMEVDRYTRRWSRYYSPQPGTGE